MELRIACLASWPSTGSPAAPHWMDLVQELPVGEANLAAVGEAHNYHDADTILTSQTDHQE